MPWLQAHLLGDPDSAPLLELRLEQLGALSVTIRDAGDEPILEPAPGDTRLWKRTRVTGLFPGETDPEALRLALDRAGARVELEWLADQNWERAWLDRFAPMRFGERLWIRPSGFRVDAPDAVIIDLDPGLAFGTGTHPTTALCLRWLDAHPPAARDVIDFGCGSGILAIAAARLGARRVHAIDHDPQALLASADNARRNGCRDTIAIHAATAPEPPVADLVMANILASTLLELRASLTRLVKRGGDLLLSGILAEQAEEVSMAYAADFDFPTSERQGDWVLLHATRR